MPTALWACLGSAAAVAIAGCCFITSYALALRLVSTPSLSVRLCGVVTASFWSLAAVFSILAPAGMFSVGVILPLWAVGAGFVVWRLRAHGHESPISFLFSCMDAARRLLRRDIPRILVLATGAVVALLALRIFRSLVAPPMSWDSLTYHLFKAGSWVQHAGFFTDRAPDQCAFFDFYLPLGDALWAWAMLPVHGDLLLGYAYALVWLSILLAGYAAAREFGVATKTALLAALTIATIPGVFEYATSAYVEPQIVALFLLGSVFLARFCREVRPGYALLTLAAFAVLAGTKHNYAPVLAVCFLLVVWWILRRTAPSLRSRVSALAGCLAAIAVAVPPYLRAWMAHGSPLYPLPLTLLGRTLLPGNEEMVLYDAGRLTGRMPFSVLDFLRTLFDPLYATPAAPHHLGFGPLMPLIVIAGIFGAWSLARRRENRAVTILLSVVSGFIVLSLLTDDYYGIWAMSPYLLGRFWSPVASLAIICASAVKGPGTAWLLGAALASHLLLGLPHGWSAVDAASCARLLAWWTPALAVVILLARMLRGKMRSPLACAVTLVVAGVLALPQLSVRDAYRYRYYESCADQGRSHDVHPLRDTYASSWTIWRALDGGKPHRLAVAAGWGHGVWNWYRYPLLGSSLQNRIFYIPVTRSGRVIDYRKEWEVLPEADFSSWLSRLREERIDVVVALAPVSVEDGWMRAHPEIFTPLVSSANGLSHAYGVR